MTARQPSDAAVEVALMEDQPSWHKMPEDLRSELRLRMRAALEAAYRVDVPKPAVEGWNETAPSQALLDRGALAERLSEVIDRSMETGALPLNDLLDAVMELARPMPTREQIAAGLHKAFDHPNTDKCPITATGWHECGYIDQSNHLTAVVLALLNGDAS